MVNPLVVFDNVKFINRLTYLIFGLAIFIITTSAAIYFVQNLFKINQIIITGNTSHITNEQLSYIAQNKLRGTLFTLDIDSLQREFRRIPWVKSVTVTREFPDIIRVNVKEYEVLARFNDDSLISKDGWIFNGADDSTTLPVFTALPSQVPQLLADYNKIEPVIGRQKKLNVTQITLKGQGIVRLIFSNSLEVVICDGDVTTSIDLLLRYWDDLYKLNPNLNYVNMCYKNAVAINAPRVSSVNVSGG